MGLKNYLRFIQRAYLLLYRTGMLKYNSNYDYHYFVKHLVDKGEVVIDIGANIGYYSLLFARWVGDSGKVFAVEPNRVYNEVFSERAKKYKNITLYPYALENETQMLKPSVLFENLDKIDYIKCDIEGHEYFILSDMKEIIRKFKPKVQVKVLPENREKLFELFEELGYTPYKLYKYRLIPQDGDTYPVKGDYIFIEA